MATVWNNAAGELSIRFRVNASYHSATAASRNYLLDIKGTSTGEQLSIVNGVDGNLNVFVTSKGGTYFPSPWLPASTNLIGFGGLTAGDHTISLTWSGGVMYAYLDGAYLSSVPAVPNFVAGDSMTLGSAVDGTLQWNELIHDFRISKVSRTAAELLELAGMLDFLVDSNTMYRLDWSSDVLGSYITESPGTWVQGSATTLTPLNAVSGSLGVEVLAAATGETHYVDNVGIFQGTNQTFSAPGSIVRADAQGLYVGSSTFSSAPFRVDMTGTMVANKASLNGLAGQVTLNIGSGANTMGVDSNGLWLGSSTFAGAPFRVDYTGAAVASNLTLAGGSMNGTITLASGGAINIAGSTGIIRLGSTTSSGARVELTSSSFTAYNTGGTATFAINAATGGITMTGPVITSGSISGASLAIPNTSTANSFQVDTSGNLWSGATTFAAAPFSVSNAGALLAKNLVLDATGMTASTQVFKTTATTLTAGGTLTTTNIVANGGVVGGVLINATVSTTTNGSHTLPLATITVTSTTGFATSGVITVGGQSVSYTGTTSTTFTGCTGGTGTIATGSAVYQGGLQGGLISGATYQIASGGGIQFTGSGNITWSAAATGGITVGNSGFVRSSNYSAGTAGWSLGATGLEINGGTIRAAALQIGISSVNYVVNSSFVNQSITSYPLAGTPNSWNTYSSNMVVGIYNDHGLFGRQNARLNWTALGWGYLYQDVIIGPVIPVGTEITVSFWAYQTTGTAIVPRVAIDYPAGTNVFTYDAPTLTLNQWTRVVATWKTTASYVAASVFRVYFGTNVGPSGAVMYLDGTQVQLSSFATDYAPAPLEIPDNYIQTAWISGLTVDKLTAGNGIINNLVINGGTISSFNYGSSAGYQLGTNGATFQNGGVTIIGASGTLTLDSSSLRAVYSGTTKFKVDSTGVYIGGTDTTTAQVYFNTTSGKTIFQKSGSGATFTIDSSGTTSSNRYIHITDATGNDTFYVTNDGLGYFQRGTVSGNGQNFVRNSSFEAHTGKDFRGGSTNTGFDDWYDYNWSPGTADPAITWSQAQNAYHGQYSARLQWTTNTGNKGIRQFVTTSNNDRQWKANTTYMISCWVYFNNANIGTPSLAADAGGFTDTLYQAPASPAQAVWYRYAWKRVIGGSNVLTHLYIAWAGLNNGDVLLDGVQVEEGPVLTSYAPKVDEVLPIGINGNISDDIRSQNYVAGSSGWMINGNGVAEFGSVTIRGTLSTSSITGWLTIASGGGIRTAPATAGLARWELSSASADYLMAYTGHTFEMAPGGMYTSVVNTGSNAFCQFRITSSSFGSGQALIYLNSTSHDNTIPSNVFVSANDGLNVNGRSQLGCNNWPTYANFQYQDLATNNYAILQASDANTYVNSGATLWLRYQNSNRMAVNVNGVDMQSNMSLNQNGFYTYALGNSSHFGVYEGGTSDGFNWTENGGFRLHGAAWDIGETVGWGASTVRTVNNANNGYRIHEASAHNNVSDIRFKDVVRTAESHPRGHHRDMVRVVGRPFKFRWKKGSGDDGKNERWGHDANVLPAEFTAEGGPFAGESTVRVVDPQSMIAALFGAYNDLMDDYEDMEQQLSTFEARLAQLEHGKKV